MYTPSSESIELDFNENLCCNHQEMCHIYAHSFYSPFKHGYMHPYSCFAHVKQNQPTRRNNPFANAYDWYKRDRWPRNQVNTSGAGLQNLRDKEVKDFSRWLDYKYDQYLQEQELSKYECPGSIDNEYTYAEPENLDYIMKPKVTDHKSSVINVPLIESQSYTSSDTIKTNTSFLKSKSDSNKKCYKCRNNIPVDMGAIIVPNIKGKVGKKILQENEMYVPSKPKLINVETQCEPAPFNTEQPKKKKTEAKKQNKQKSTKPKDCATGPSVIFMEVKDSATYQTDSYVKATPLCEFLEHNELNATTSDELFKQLQKMCYNEQSELLPPRRPRRYECGCINDTSQTSDVALNVNEVLNQAAFVKIIQRKRNPEKGRKKEGGRKNLL